MSLIRPQGNNRIRKKAVDIVTILRSYKATSKGIQLYEKAEKEEWFENFEQSSMDIVEGKWTAPLEVLAAIIESSFVEPSAYNEMRPYLGTAVQVLLSEGYITEAQ